MILILYGPGDENEIRNKKALLPDTQGEHTKCYSSFAMYREGHIKSCQPPLNVPMGPTQRLRLREAERSQALFSGSPWDWLDRRTVHGADSSGSSESGL